MSTTILLPDDLAARLKREAETNHTSIEDVALGILSNACNPSAEDVVARITSSTRPSNVRPAHASLADALRNGPDTPDFDLAEWNRHWTAVDAEIKAMAHPAETQ